MTDEEAREAVAAYAEGPGRPSRSPTRPSATALDTLKAWMRRRGDTKATVERKDGQPRAVDEVLRELPQAQRGARP